MFAFDNPRGPAQLSRSGVRHFTCASPLRWACSLMGEERKPEKRVGCVKRAATSWLKFHQVALGIEIDITEWYQVIENINYFCHFLFVVPGYGSWCTCCVGEPLWVFPLQWYAWLGGAVFSWVLSGIWVQYIQRLIIFLSPILPYWEWNLARKETLFVTVLSVLRASLVLWNHHHSPQDDQ